MTVSWDDVNRVVFPIKSYADACRRLHESFTFPIVCQHFNFPLPALAAHTRQLLGGDPQGRYNGYAALLTGILDRLYQAGVPDLQDLLARVGTPEHLEGLTAQSGVPAQEVAGLVKYLVYWVVPMDKYLSGLVRDEPGIRQSIKALAGVGIRTNLALLQHGFDPESRQALSDTSGLPGEILLELVHRADLSRMPWASKATIANLCGAGYGSLTHLAGAVPEQLYEAFDRYGKSIGKNLNHGNEIENSYRIAKILPPLVLEV